jgi:hypothetical protein
MLRLAQGGTALAQAFPLAAQSLRPLTPDALHAAP